MLEKERKSVKLSKLRDKSRNSTAEFLAVGEAWKNLTSTALDYLPGGGKGVE